MTGIQQLQAKFKEVKQRAEQALITYITAGDPNLTTTSQLIQAMAQAGADIIELGVPFSDPVADGPVIQRASNRSLANGTNLKAILQLVAEVRPKVTTPLVLMTYYNPILQYGLANFCSAAAEAGVAGLIVPDLPLEETTPLLKAVKETELAYIPLVAPTTGQERLAQIAAIGGGFIYSVTVTGITGTKQNVTSEIARLAREIRDCTDLPLAAGFGIATPEQAQAVAQHCDAVVVGSALVKLVEEYGVDSSAAVAELTSKLKAGLRS